MRIPLRGEVTSSASSAVAPPMTRSIDSMQDILGQMIRLSASSANATVPEIIVSPSHEKDPNEAVAGGELMKENRETVGAGAV